MLSFQLHNILNSRYRLVFHALSFTLFLVPSNMGTLLLTLKVFHQLFIHRNWNFILSFCSHQNQKALQLPYYLQVHLHTLGLDEWYCFHADNLNPQASVLHIFLLVFRRMPRIYPIIALLIPQGQIPIKYLHHSHPNLTQYYNIWQYLDGINSVVTLFHAL